MIKNAKSLKDKARNVASENAISIQQVLQNYMFERVLERLSKSEYRENFIIKGGLLLSSIMGISTRTTMDMDTSVKGINLTDTELYKILKEILDINIGDNVKFQIINSTPIREEDDYGGLKYNIVAIFDNLRVNLSIDIATGDTITPKEIEYNYKMLFEDRKLQIMTYNIESIIAEKFQTVVSRGILNSRMKDYYDLYYLITYKKFSKENLKQAITKTFEKRNTNLKEIENTLSKIKESSFIKELWENYSKKHRYTENIKFEEIINTIYKIRDIIN